MSWYVHYYLGYKTKEDKIYPLGPYDCFGHLYNIFYRSRSFTSDLHEDFFKINEQQSTDELKKSFSYENYDGEIIFADVEYLPLNKLPSGSYVKSGYFLIEDIQNYLKDEDPWDLFYDCLDPTTYALKMESELKFGKPTPKKDCEGNEITEHSCADYAYFAYPDYFSKEYESALIRNAAEMYEFIDLPDEAEIVVLKREG